MAQEKERSVDVGVRIRNQSNESASGSPDLALRYAIVRQVRFLMLFHSPSSQNENEISYRIV